MHQPRTNLGKALSRSRNRRQPRSPQTDRAEPSSPLDAITKGLVAIGERFFKGGRAQLRTP